MLLIVEQQSSKHFNRTMSFPPASRLAHSPSPSVLPRAIPLPPLNTPKIVPFPSRRGVATDDEEDTADDFYAEPNDEYYYDGDDDYYYHLLRFRPTPSPTGPTSQPSEDGEALERVGTSHGDSASPSLKVVFVAALVISSFLL